MGIMIYRDTVLAPFFRSRKDPIVSSLYWQSCYWFQWLHMHDCLYLHSFYNKAFPLGSLTYSLLKCTLWCVKYAACIRLIPHTAALKHSTHSPSAITSGFYHNPFPVSRHKRLSYVHKPKLYQRLTVLKQALLNSLSPRIIAIVFRRTEKNLELVL